MEPSLLTQIMFGQAAVEYATRNPSSAPDFGVVADLFAQHPLNGVAALTNKDCERLWQRYFGTVDDVGEMGRVVKGLVRTYIDHGLSGVSGSSAKATVDETTNSRPQVLNENSNTGATGPSTVISSESDTSSRNLHRGSSEGETTGDEPGQVLSRLEQYVSRGGQRQERQKKRDAWISRALGLLSEVGRGHEDVLNRAASAGIAKEPHTLKSLTRAVGEGVVDSDEELALQVYRMLADAVFSLPRPAVAEAVEGVEAVFASHVPLEHEGDTTEESIVELDSPRRPLRPKRRRAMYN